MSSLLHDTAVAVSGYPQTWRLTQRHARTPGCPCRTCGRDTAAVVVLEAVDPGCEDMRLTCCECRARPTTGADRPPASPAH